MKMFVVFVILLHVSQHALAGVVEVNEGERSVLLSCLNSGSIPEDNPTVMWTRSDLNPKSVHWRRRGDDLKGQNQRYRERTSMRPDALDSSDFSLTLKKTTKTDSGNYTCSISDGRQERRVTDIQLKVKDQQLEVKVEEGSESVILPCKTTPDLPEDTRVEWTRSDLRLMMVHEYSNRNDELITQDEVYRDRTKMNEDLLRTGDLSLTLKYPTERDSGEYICTIYRDKDILRQKVVLQVKGYKVKVDAGKESVKLPCKAIVRFLNDTRVEWTDKNNRKVHVYENDSDQPEKQQKFYKQQTKMERNLLKSGDFSLTLTYPIDDDNSTYTCTIYSREGIILKKKQVELHVRVPQVDVDSGEASILLPCKATQNLPKNAKIEWWDRFNKKVHMYENGSDQLEDQNSRYRGRTMMNKDLLKTGDLSLTLKYPTDWDTDIYTCTVYNREGKKIQMMKQVELKVRVCEVEEQEGAESVQLPCKTTENLPADAKVVWWDIDDRKVHVFNNGSENPGEQDEVYRGRTKMKQNLLKTGDLSLSLTQPRVRDSGG
ncbi:butyrophilin [Sarotherodon galilaeus]